MDLHVDWIEELSNLRISLWRHWDVGPILILLLCSGMLPSSAIVTVPSSGESGMMLWE
jgi:hypothetical protein